MILDPRNPQHICRLFRLAAIVQQIYYRYYHGQTQDKRFASFVQMNAMLEQMILNVIKHSRL